MPFVVANRRLASTTITARYGADAVICDVTSRGPAPWVRFSPFYPHGDIPVPFSPGITSMSVEGIWQGLKVFANADVDATKFAVTTMHGIKRSVKKLGAVLGHRCGVQGSSLLGYAEACREIYLPAYRWVLDYCLQHELAELRDLGTRWQVVFLDYETNTDIADLTRPLAHAALIVRYLQNEWPA